MFDNLKKKLGSFREDAEEAAEENVEEVEDEELEEAELDDAPLEDDDLETASEPEIPDTTGTPAEETDEPECDLERGRTPAETAATADAAADSSASELDAELATEREDEPEPVEGEPEPVEGEPEPVDDSADAAGTAAVGEPEPVGTSEPEDANPVDDAAATADDSIDEEEPETDDDNGGTGFGAKARSLVKGKFVIEEEDLEGPLHELEMALLTSDVEMGVAEEILENIREELIGETRTFTTSTGEVVEEALHDAIYDVISVGQFDFDERIAVEDKPVTIIFTGVNGVGKTTSIAKMSRYFEERGYSTVMANGDTYRAGANEQIQEHADALDTKCISHEQGGDPAAVLYDAVEYAEANDIDVVLGDTAGRLHTDEGLMDQLEKIDRVVGPDMTLFVDEAVAGQDAVNRAREFDEAAEIDGAILSKADADSNGGAAISIAHVTGKPILFLGVGQGYDDLERFDPDEMVERLLADDE
jgi:fused signal recognition particle receptor